MFHKTILTMLSLFILTGAGFTQTIGFQSYILDDDEPLADGQYNITFRLYNQAEEGETIWEETQEVTVSSGVFHVELGSVDPISILPFNTQYWVSVQLPGRDEMGRLKLSHAPYAFSAEFAFSAENALSADSAEHAFLADRLTSEQTFWRLPENSDLDENWSRIDTVPIGMVSGTTLIECHAQYRDIEYDDTMYSFFLQFRFHAGGDDIEGGAHAMYHVGGGSIDWHFARTVDEPTEAQVELWGLSEHPASIEDIWIRVEKRDIESLED